MPHRRRPAPAAVRSNPAHGDLVVVTNTAGHFMHFAESRSHQFPLHKNVDTARGDRVGRSTTPTVHDRRSASRQVADQRRLVLPCAAGRHPSTPSRPSDEWTTRTTSCTAGRGLPGTRPRRDLTVPSDRCPGARCVRVRRRRRPAGLPWLLRGIRRTGISSTPTGMTQSNALVRIGYGRDAADTPCADLAERSISVLSDGKAAAEPSAASTTERGRTRRGYARADPSRP